MFPTSNFLSDGPRYERDGAAVEAGLDAFLQVGRQFLLVSRHLFLMAILARARIGLLLLGHRCFSPYSCLLGCPRMPGYPTRETLRIPLQACRRAGVRRARLGRDGNPEAPVTHGTRSRHARSTSTCTASPRAARAKSQRPEIAADYALLLASDCDRLASRASDARNGLSARAPRADVRTSAFPGRKQACTRAPPALVRVVRSGRLASLGPGARIQATATLCIVYRAVAGSARERRDGAPDPRCRHIDGLR